MKIEKKENYTVISPSETTFGDFFSTINDEISTYKNEHLFIDLLNTFSINAEDLTVFTEISNKKKAEKTSFILISDSIEIDTFEDEILSIVPTIQEAEDVLEMDAIERDLGF
jgi:hypothetical protein